MKFEHIKPGATLWDVHKYRMGNTTIRSWGCWPVLIESVNPDTRTALARWNGNPPELWFERDLKKLRKVRPEMVKGFFGSERPMTRAEKAARAAALTAHPAALPLPAPVAGQPGKPTPSDSEAGS